MDVTCWLLVSIAILTVVYWLLTKNYGHWQKQNVPCVTQKPLPGVGNIISVLTLKENLVTYIDKLYKSTNSSMIGFYFVLRPALLVRDAELVKSVLATNFSDFHNNLLNLSEKNDPVMIKNPFFATDLDKWKAARIRTTSHLTGKKLAQLHVILQEVCSRMVAYTERRIDENEEFYECEMKDYFYKYTGEFVANAAFAIEGQSYEDNPSPKSFATIVKSLLAPTLMNGIKITIMIYLPSIGNLLGFCVMEPKVESYLRQNLKAILKERSQMKNPPTDYLQFVLDADGDKNTNSIIADILVFFGDVYETSSTTLAVLYYQLSKNKEVQDKLREHVKSVLETTNGIVTYESLKNMTYLDQVISESMRIIPSVGALLKICTEKTTLKGPDGVTCHLKPGDPVFIPVLSVQNDAKYWKNPETFDPERFSPENQANRTKYAYLPFGEGPRQCIGMRLAQMVVKQAVATLITKFTIEYSPKNHEPFEWYPPSFLAYNTGGMWARLKKLNQEN